jgi:hypothetical protein
MSRVLVIANETIGGAKLMEAVRAQLGEPGARGFLVVPQNRPKHGGIIYDEAVRDAAQVRVDLAKQFMQQQGFEIEGEVGDEDPFTAAMDGIRHYRPDRVIVSTRPATSSGWLRRDLVERIATESGLPVEHVVTDIAAEGLPFDVTLVLANQTVGGRQLHDHLLAKSSENPHLFIVVMPLSSGQGDATASSRARLELVLDGLRSEGLLCAGMIGDPDPYNAAMNALQSFHISDIVVSTLEEAKSGWMRGHVVERLRESSGLPVEHVIAAAGAPA